MNLGWVERVDRYLIDTLESFYTWTNEWFNVDHRRAEVFMRYYFLASSVIVPGPIWLRIFLCVTGIWVWCGMREMSAVPDRVRVTRRYYGEILRCYILFMCLSIAFTLIYFPPHRWEDWASATRLIDYAVFTYSICIGDSGERGKRRAESLSKIKALFGTEWIVAPMQVPQ